MIQKLPPDTGLFRQIGLLDFTILKNHLFILKQRQVFAQELMAPYPPERACQQVIERIVMKFSDMA